MRRLTLQIDIHELQVIYKEVGESNYKGLYELIKVLRSYKGIHRIEVSPDISKRIEAGDKSTYKTGRTISNEYRVLTNRIIDKVRKKYLDNEVKDMFCKLLTEL